MNLCVGAFAQMGDFFWRSCQLITERPPLFILFFFSCFQPILRDLFLFAKLLIIDHFIRRCFCLSDLSENLLANLSRITVCQAFVSGKITQGAVYRAQNSHNQQQWEGGRQNQNQQQWEGGRQNWKHHPTAFGQNHAAGKWALECLWAHLARTYITLLGSLQCTGASIYNSLWSLGNIAPLKQALQ